MDRGEGERLHEQRRKRFWSLITWLFVGGMVTGVLAGVALGPALHGAPVPAWAGILGTLAVVLSVIAVAYGSWRFFENVDEVEVADNLWASLIGFYAYAILFPAWWALWKLNQAPEPHDWVVWATAFIIAAAAYGWRKWQSR